MATLLRSEKLMRKKRLKRTLVAILVVVIFVLCVAIPSWVSHSEAFRINDVLIEGNTLVSSESIQTIAKDLMAGKYIYVFSKTSIFTYPKKTLEKSILNSDPRIKSAKVSIQGLHALVVTLEEREPYALWCDEGDTCYAMDINGYIFGDAPQFSSATIYPIYGGMIEEPIGKYFLSPEVFKILENYRKGLIDLKIEPQKILVDKEKTGSAIFENGSKIFFSLEDDVLQTLSNLTSILQDESLGLIQQNTLIVESVDMRFGNKVIVKKKPI